MFKKLRAMVLLAAVVSVFPSTSASAVVYPQEYLRPDDAPFAVSLWLTEHPGLADVDRDPFCSGALISERYVLTVAHCVVDLFPEQVFVGIGGSSKDTMTLVQAGDFVSNKGYLANDFLWRDDIAVIRLAEPVRWAAPIAVTPPRDSSLIAPDKKLSLYGWGIDELEEVPHMLATTRQRNYSSTASKWHPTFNPKIQIAAGRRVKGKWSSACSGDSGGPLVATSAKGRRYLVGLVSYGRLACAQAPAVFTRVSAYRSWIKATKAHLEQRAATAPLNYFVIDALTDGEGVDAPYVDIANVGVEATETSATFAVKFAPSGSSSAERYVDLLAFDGRQLARIDAAGLRTAASGDAVVCPAVLSTEVEGYDYAWTVDSTCLIGVVGTRFDAVFSSRMFDSADGTVSGYDSASILDARIPMR